MSKTIEGINKYVSILEWTNTISYETFSMDAEVFGELSGVLAQYQRHAECLTAMNSCLQQLKLISSNES